MPRGRPKKVKAEGDVKEVSQEIPPETEQGKSPHRGGTERHLKVGGEAE